MAPVIDRRYGLGEIPAAFHYIEAGREKVVIDVCGGDRPRSRQPSKEISEMNYGEILSRALAISWRHKYLWLLALFAGEGAMFGLQNTQSLPGRRNGGGSQLGAGTSDQFAVWAAAHVGLLWSAAIVLALLFIALLLISAVANGALIKAAAEHDQERPFGLGPAWSSGVRTFWPVLQMKLLTLVLALATLLVVGSLALVAVAGARAGYVALAVGSGVSAGLLLLLAIPFWIVFSVVVLLALRAIVLDGMRPVAALGSGFELIRRRLGRVALVWLLAGVAGIGGGLAVGIAVVIVALPLAGIVAATYFTAGVAAAVAVGVAAGLIWVAVLLALSGGVTAFTSTFWTLAYTRFDQEPQPVAAGSPLPA
jgi:hypothetical protein